MVYSRLRCILLTASNLLIANTAFLNRFLLAQFHMDSIAYKTKRRDIHRALENLPSELEANYDEIMKRIAE